MLWGAVTSIGSALTACAAPATSSNASLGVLWLRAAVVSLPQDLKLLQLAGPAARPHALRLLPKFP